MHHRMQELGCNNECPPEIFAAQRVLKVDHHGLDGRSRMGFIMVHKDIASDVECIFREIWLSLEFPIAKMMLLGNPMYNWDDERSMRDNNTSGFNYRPIAGTDTLSYHAVGCAIDINPWFNPFIQGRTVFPSGAIYNPDTPGTITRDSLVVAVFRQYGFEWGGDYQDRKDYQHFFKPLPELLAWAQGEYDARKSKSLLMDERSKRCASVSQPK